jgi:putative Mg2+ transporter-C (MgtC) family protein
MSPDLTMAIRMIVAAILSGAIGYQREKAGKPAGLRTHMLICIGACLFTLTGMYAFGTPADPSRIAAGVVSGIGFLGAGAIIFRSSDGYIAGLTTAATIWAVAGLGVAVGAGLYIPAVITTIIILIVLFIPHLR